MSLYKSFRLDETKEINGIRLVYNFKPEYKNDDGTWPVFIVKRPGGSNSREFENAKERAVRAYTSRTGIDDFSETDLRIILIDTYVDSVFVGWENIYDFAGNLIEFNPSNVSKFFNELPELFIELHSRINKKDLFLKYSENDLKNW